MHTHGLLVAAALLAGCNGPLQSPTVASRMRDHDRLGAAIRDAVARGDLEEATRQATALATLPVGGPIDAAWKSKLDAMRVAADRISDAADVNQAAHGLGPLAKTCGDCHTMLGRPGPATGQASGVRPFMARHEWAVSQMWDGLVIPSEDAWNAGALALAEEPISPEQLTPGKSPVPKVGLLEESVHELGRKAQTATQFGVRAQVYADAMATCAGCHRWLGGGPHPGEQ